MLLVPQGKWAPNVPADNPFVRSLHRSVWNAYSAPAARWHPNFCLHTSHEASLTTCRLPYSCSATPLAQADLCPWLSPRDGSGSSEIGCICVSSCDGGSSQFYVFKGSAGSESRQPGFEPSSAPCQLCNHEQITEPLSA